MPESPAVGSWREELRAALLYRAMAEHGSDEKRPALFLALATEAEHQAAIWAKAAKRSGHIVPPSFEADTRTRIVAALVHWLGPKRVRGIPLASRSAFLDGGRMLLIGSAAGSVTYAIGSAIGVSL